jgi:hypothetical protein
MNQIFFKKSDRDNLKKTYFFQKMTNDVSQFTTH